MNYHLKNGAIYLDIGSAVFTKQSGSPFVELRSSAAELYGVDLDGDLDLFFCGSDTADINRGIFYLNDCAGNFTEVATESISGASVGNANFGDVDLFVIGYSNGEFISEVWINNTAITMETDIVTDIGDSGLYPNPTSGDLYFNELTSVRIWSTDGKLIVSESNRNSFNIDHLESGLYFVEVTTEDGVGVVRVVKE